MKVVENRTRVVAMLGINHKSRSSIVDSYVAVYQGLKQAEQTVGVVWHGGYECVHESFDVHLGNIFAHTANVPDDE